MTKQDLQKELKEKVRPGVKPSTLKRSKSAGDIPKASPLLSVQTTALTRSKSSEVFNDPKYPFTTLISQQEELEKLRKESETKSTTIALLRKKNEELEKLSKERVTQNDALLVKLAEVYEELNKAQEAGSSAELDQALFARHKSLKDWFAQYQKNKKLDKELAQNINEASNELTEQDQTLTKLRTENRKLKQTNQSLQKDLTLTQRLAQSRKTPLPNLPHPDYLKYALYALSAIWIIMILLKAQKANTPTLNQEPL